MNNRLINKLEMFDGIFAFSTTPGLPVNPRATAIFPQVKTVADAIREHLKDQASGQGIFLGGSHDRFRSATELRVLVGNVAKIGGVLNPVQYPGIAEKLTGPRTGSYQALLASARSMLEHVGPVKAAIVERGMPADFDEVMQGLITDLDAATVRKAGGLIGQAGGTEALYASAEAGMKLVKELKAIMSPLLRNLPALRGAWKVASRVKRAPAASVVPSVAPAPASAPVGIGGTGTTGS